MIRMIIPMLLVLFVMVSAQQPAPIANKVAPRTLSYIYSQKVSKAVTVDELSSILSEAFNSLYSVEDDAVPDLYGKTNGYLDNVKPGIAKNRNRSETKTLFSACSLKTLAAVMQLVQARYDRDLRQLLEQRNEMQIKENGHISISHRFIRFDDIQEPLMIEFFSINGRKIFGKMLKPRHGTALFPIPVDVLEQGQYILRTTVGGKQIINRFNHVRQ